MITTFEVQKTLVVSLDYGVTSLAQAYTLGNYDDAEYYFSSLAHHLGKTPSVQAFRKKFRHAGLLEVPTSIVKITTVGDWGDDCYERPAIFKKLKSVGFRPANALETLMFGAQHPDEQREDSISSFDPLERFGDMFGLQAGGSICWGEVTWHSGKSHLRGFRAGISYGGAFPEETRSRRYLAVRDGTELCEMDPRDLSRNGAG